MATDTSAVNNKDAFIRKFDPTVNRGSLTDLHVFNRNDNNDIRRSIIHFTLPSDPGGTVTDVSLYLYGFAGSKFGATPWKVNVHQLTQTGWVESQNTWNRYATGLNWATAGGDYNTTVIDQIDGVGNHSAWVKFDIMGGSALNPLSLTWGDELHLLLKVDSETGGIGNWLEENYYSKEFSTPSLRPYLEVTYTTGGGAPHRSQFRAVRL